MPEIKRNYYANTTANIADVLPHSLELPGCYALIWRISFYFVGFNVSLTHWYTFVQELVLPLYKINDHDN